MKKSIAKILVVMTLAACQQNTPNQQTQKNEDVAPVQQNPAQQNPVTLVKKLDELKASQKIAPLPESVDVDAAKVALGDALFHDKRLSHDNTISCASCHDLAKGGTDQTPVSTGVGGKKGGINSPTVYNAVFNFVQFWDGRAKDLFEQARGPVHNPIEMASDWKEVIGKLEKDTIFVETFKKIYPEGLTGENIQDAIAQFESSLITPGSRFDKYLAGDKKALSETEIKGYGLFEDYGCITCHNGVNLGGTSYQKLGLVKDYFKDRGNITDADYGRYNVTKNEADKHKFKVPSLRVAALTAPYFHDASQKTLADAVRTMGKYQIGMDLKDDEVEAIVAFLKSVVGNYKGKNLLDEAK